MENKVESALSGPIFLFSVTIGYIFDAVTYASYASMYFHNYKVYYEFQAF